MKSSLSIEGIIARAEILDLTAQDYQERGNAALAHYYQKRADDMYKSARVMLEASEGNSGGTSASATRLAEMTKKLERLIIVTIELRNNGEHKSADFYESRQAKLQADIEAEHNFIINSASTRYLKLPHEKEAKHGVTAAQEKVFSMLRSLVSIKSADEVLVSGLPIKIHLESYGLDLKVSLCNTICKIGRDWLAGARLGKPYNELESAARKAISEIVLPSSDYPVLERDL